MEKKQPNEILFTSDVDKYGLLTIKFSFPIDIPSYLIRELDSENP